MAGQYQPMVPYGSVTAARTYNPYTGVYGATRQGSNAYGNWGSSVAVRGDQWAQTAHRTTSQGTAAGFRTSEGARGVGVSGANGNSGFLAQDKNDNVYAGRNGDVYRKDSSGIGRSMRTAAGRTQVLSRRRMLRMRHGPKGHKASSVPVRGQATELALHSSQPSRQRRGNSSIETLEHARRGRSERSSSSGRGRVVRGVQEGQDAGDRNDPYFDV